MTKTTLLVLAFVASALVIGVPMLMWAQEQPGSTRDRQHGAEAPEPGQAESTAHDGDATRTIYTCSMHPQIVQDQPGTCPICGMDLTEKTVGQAAAPQGKQRKIKYWVAPMDPTYIRDEPGKSPMGMDLVPVYEDAEPSHAGVVTIDPVVVQNMGVRIAPVERGPISRSVRTIGSVEVAEDEISVVNLRYSGWIERIYVDETGSYVKKGQRLFDIYSPELVSAESELLMSLRSGAGSELVESARSKLRFWDLSEAQIAAIQKRGTASRTLTVVAPQSGYVLHKNVVQGARVQAGVDLYRIGSLSKIWVNADVYEFDAPWVAVGNRATMELSFEAGKRYEGRVSYIYPTLNPKTRTLTVRLEFANPGLVLKPGMFATVQIEAQHKADVIKVPTEAIIHSGTRQVVFVATALGKYAMREITTGLTGDRYVTEVLSGLSEGERVVISGQFLLDSESQLQEAVEKLLSARLQANEPASAASAGAGGGEPGQEHSHATDDAPAPATEHSHTSEPAPGPTGHSHKHGAATPKASPAGPHTPKRAAPSTAKPAVKPTQREAPSSAAQDSYWTCSMHPQVVQDHPGNCPICGMTLVEKQKPSRGTP